MPNLITSNITHPFQEKFTQVWQFMRANKLHKSPLYLVIGSYQQGKSLLIQQSGLTFISADNLIFGSGSENNDHNQLQWFFSDKANFLELSALALNKSGETCVLISEQIKKLARKHVHLGILLVLDFAQFTRKNKQEQQALIEEYKSFLDKLKTTISSPCPLYLILTHIDEFDGFSEFFADLGQEERYRPCGFTIDLSSSDILENIIKNLFTALINRLHQRVIWRLQHERNTTKRILMQQFPIQIENAYHNLQLLITQLVKLVNPHSKLFLQGIYLVSNAQNQLISGRENTKLTKSILNTYKQYQSYFTQLLFQTILAKKQLRLPSIVNQANKKLHWVYAGAVGLVLVISGFIAFDYSQKINDINAAKVALAQYQLLAKHLATTNTSLDHVLPALNLLHNAVTALDAAKLPWLIAQGVHQTSAYNLTNNTYQSALNLYFLPILGNLLEQILNSTQDPVLLYGGLKIYLMLGDKKAWDSNFIKNWLNHYWQIVYNHDAILQQQLNTHLANLLDKPTTPLSLNQIIINKARENLNNLAVNDLAYAILKNQLPSKMHAVLADNSIIHTKDITDFYTAKNFPIVYFELINQACDAALKGDAITGTKEGPEIKMPQLNRQLQIRYLQDYANEWQHIVSSIQLVQLQTINQADRTLTELLDTNSPLLELLQTVKSNTDITNSITFANNNDKQLIQTYLTTPFSDVNNLLVRNNQNKNDRLNQSLLTLHDLQKILKRVASSHNQEKAAFEFTKDRFNQSNTNSANKLDLFSTQSENLPSLLQGLIRSIKSNLWQLMINNTNNYLNQIWQQEVIPYYSTQMALHYPFSKQSVNDISLAHLANFFGKQGILDNYFQKYLSSFIDNSTVQWQLKKIDGLSIMLSTNMMTELERAAIIRNMFFNKENKLTINFSLQQINLSSNVKRFSFTFNQQTFADQNGNKKIHTFHWPDISDKQNIDLIFIDENGKQTNKTLTGTWALFRVFDSAQLQQQKDTRHFELTFDLNGQAARYLLIAENPVNPFIPNIIQQFQLPSVLAEKY